MHKQLTASNIDTFLVRGRKTSAGEAERTAAPDYDKKISAASHASEASVGGSNLSAGEAGRSGKREFGGFRNQQCMKKGNPALGLSPCY